MLTYMSLVDGRMHTIGFRGIRACHEVEVHGMIDFESWSGL
jgi:hypothetical protein